VGKPLDPGGADSLDNELYTLHRLWQPFDLEWLHSFEEATLQTGMPAVVSAACADLPVKMRSHRPDCVSVVPQGPAHRAAHHASSSNCYLAQYLPKSGFCLLSSGSRQAGVASHEWAYRL